jgi:hypothetical protein
MRIADSANIVGIDRPDEPSPNGFLFDRVLGIRSPPTGRRIRAVVLLSYGTVGKVAEDGV